LASASFYLSGIVVLINALLPLVYFYTGLMPLTISTMGLAVAFLPYIFLTVITLQLSSNYSYTFRALSFSMSNFTIHIKAVAAVLLRQKIGFAVTSTTRLAGNFIRMVTPHLAYILLTAAGVGVAIWREGLNASLLSNLAWALFNIAVFLPFISAALPQPKTLQATEPQARSSSVPLNKKLPPIPSPKAAVNRAKLFIPHKPR
jgi:cellulose synthase (UDP-forming)